ncbi:wd40 repeat protein [Anaeramoeba flamelloides]|uniref:Wd40 repeat protein n=1 Tax=Anaeramoeba flamelloides TaxID=1746091 RepID=A0ABQ8YL33_9EUKA|nr:wd40 repeat protein [Anaeramoeba flamelloides]
MTYNQQNNNSYYPQTNRGGYYEQESQDQYSTIMRGNVVLTNSPISTTNSSKGIEQNVRNINSNSVLPNNNPRGRNFQIGGLDRTMQTSTERTTQGKSDLNNEKAINDLTETQMGDNWKNMEGETQNPQTIQTEKDVLQNSGLNPQEFLQTFVPSFEMQRTLNRDRVNYFVYRYLHEQGYKHTAFMFLNESASKTSVMELLSSETPPNELISLLQSGSQYTEIENSLSNRLSKEEIEKLDQQLQMLKNEENKNNKEKEEEKDKDKEIEQEQKDENEIEKQKEKGNEIEIEKVDEKEQEQGNEKEKEKKETDNQKSIKIQHEYHLKGHSSDVSVLCWSTVDDFLATGSSDCTAKIWNLSNTIQIETNEPIIIDECISLDHRKQAEQKYDVTSLDWRKDGKFLATASYDGKGKVWSSDGILQGEFYGHDKPIFSIRWNESGKNLLTCSFDKTAIIWDANTREELQRFMFHSSPVLDIAWMDNTTFASCGSDNNIYVCRFGETQPIATFLGHTRDVNSITWSPNKKLLASASDDQTSKIWDLSKTTPVLSLEDHKEIVYNVKWSNTGEGSNNPNLPLLLATASYDKTVRLWDIESGKCKHILEKHQGPVYPISFSPDGKYIASGSLDKHLYIWSVEQGELILSFQGQCEIADVCWNSNGTKIATSFSDGLILVLDLRIL